jgi:hypothetical protein
VLGHGVAAGADFLEVEQCRGYRTSVPYIRTLVGRASGMGRGVVRIGCGQGAFGESPELMRSGLDAKVDYLVCDSLAETTSGFFALDQRDNEASGFAPDLEARMSVAFPYVAANGTKVITNAGCHNPIRAHQVAVAAARAGGVTGVRIAVVFADGPAPNRARGGFCEQVYLGAAGVVKALDDGADIVITGRVADAALFLGPAVHEFGWAWDDWDRLARGAVVGHLLECSAQASGGNYSGDWWNTVDIGRTGLPIAEVDASGSAVITKPAGSGGRVSFDTVREQLLYEVHDPSAYLTPDVIVDFTTVALDDHGDDRVAVSGARGAPRPAQLRGLTFASGGWAGEAILTYSWPDAAAKGRHVTDAFVALANERGLPVEAWHCEQFGVAGFAGPMLATEDCPADPPDVTTRLAWRTADRSTATAVERLIGLTALSGPPGLQGIGRRTQGGSRVAELVDIKPFLVDREPVERQVRVIVEEVGAK